MTVNTKPNSTNEINLDIKLQQLINIYYVYLLYFINYNNN